MSYQGKSPSLTDVIEIFIEKRLSILHTAIPGIVKSYDKDTNLATVEIQVRNYFFPDEIEQDIAPLLDVMVQWPRVSPDCYMTFPIKVGTTGMIQFCERAIGNWLMDNGNTAPDEHRRFDLSDATFIPGLAPVGEMKGADPDDVVIHNGITEFRIKPNGKVSFTNSGEELVGILSDLISELLTAKTLTAIGPQSFLADTLVKLTAVKTRLDIFKA